MQQAKAKMVTSVLPMMMMTVFALSLVEIVPVTSSDCPSGYWSWGYSVCCPEGTSVVDYDINCCSAGYSAWQLDDGSTTCCEKGKICPRTKISRPFSIFRTVSRSASIGQSVKTGLLI